MMQHKQTSSTLEALDNASEATDTAENTKNLNFNESDEIKNECITSLIDKQKVSYEPVFEESKKIQVKNSVAEQVAGPMIEFLRSKTNKSPVENPDLIFFKSFLLDFKKLNGKNQRQL